MNTFSIPITVQPNDLDYNNHVNNVVYLQWVQDVAEAHWYANTTPEIRQKYVWVVINHFIEYKNPAFVNEILTATTHVDNYGTASCERHTQIVRVSDNKLIIRAKTTWCLLDKKSMKPIRITEALKSLF